MTLIWQRKKPNRSRVACRVLPGGVTACPTFSHLYRDYSTGIIDTTFGVPLRNLVVPQLGRLRA